MSRIFISYRRADSAAYAGRLYDHLSAHFGEALVFMDIDTIEPGEDFVEVLENAVGSAGAFVAVIGRDWLTITAEDGTRRLDDPNDFVRLEIATALQRNIRVIPVLVDGATMPKADQLPEELQPLRRRNALAISNERFRTDVGRLIETLERILQPPVSPEPAPITVEPPVPVSPTVEPPSTPIPDMWTQAAPTPKRPEPQQEPVAPPTIEPLSQPVADIWTQAAPTPQRSEPEHQPAAPPKIEPQPIASVTKDLFAKPYRYSDENVDSVSFDEPDDGIIQRVYKAVASKIPTPLLILSIGWGVIWLFIADIYAGVMFDYSLVNRGLVLHLIGLLIMGAATSRFEPRFNWRYYILGAAGWLIVSWAVGFQSFDVLRRLFNPDLSYSQMIVSGGGFYVMTSSYGVGSLIFALLLWRPARLINWVQVLLITLIWVTLWLGVKIFVFKTTVISDSPSWFLVNFLAGTLVGLIGGGVMFYMLRRARLSAD